MIGNGKFVQFRTIAQVCDHVEIAGYQDDTQWPTLHDAQIGAHEIAADSTRYHQYSKGGLLVKWVIAQAATIGELGQLHWRTIETIALSPNGSRVMHIVSNLAGIEFDVDTPDDEFYPQPAHYGMLYDAARLMSKSQVIARLVQWGVSNIIPEGKYSINCTLPNGHNGLFDPRDLWIELCLYPSEILAAHPAQVDEPLAYIVDTDEPPSYEPYVAQDDIYIPSEDGHKWMGEYAATLHDEVLAEIDINTNAEISPFSPLQQIPYLPSGISATIRAALTHDLGYGEDEASSAIIAWRMMDNGGYGWIADLPNGASHYWDMDSREFRRAEPRVVLSPAQVDELLIQMGCFSDIVDEGMRLGDIDRCIDASLWVIAINRMLN